MRQVYTLVLNVNEVIHIVTEIQNGSERRHLFCASIQLSHCNTTQPELIVITYFGHDYIVLSLCVLQVLVY